MAFATDYTLATDAGFRNKVRVAICKVALAIVGEAPGAGWEKRHHLGEAILKDGGASHFEPFAFAASSYGTLSGTSTDGDIEFVVSAIFSDMAGVRQGG